jgi:hypothetical protein
MRAESDWTTAVGVGRIQDKTRWTKALDEAVPVVYGDCNEDIELSKHSSTGGVFEKTGHTLSHQSVATVPTPIAGGRTTACHLAVPG